MFFMGYFVIIFWASIPLLMLNIIFIIKYYNNKRDGKTPKKLWFVILMIFLTINITVVSFPANFFDYMRCVNLINNPPVFNEITGTMLYWTKDNSNWRSSRTWFEMNEKKYVAIHTDQTTLSQDYPEDLFYLEYGKNNLDKAVANIKYSLKNISFFNEYITWLETGITADSLGKSTIYPIKNDNGFELYHVNAYSDNCVFCPEEQLSEIRDYYIDINNYDTQNIMISYNIYSTKSERTGFRLKKPYVFVKEERILAPDVYNELERICSDNEQNFGFAKIPRKYIELAEIAASGTPIYGYDAREIYVYSKDKLAYRNIDLALIEEQVYIAQFYNMNIIDGYPIRDEELNKYLIDTLF